MLIVSAHNGLRHLSGPDAGPRRPHDAPHDDGRCAAGDGDGRLLHRRILRGQRLRHWQRPEGTFYPV